MVHRQTGSKVHRTWRCPPSAVLPHDVDEDREERTEPARGRGKGVHAFLERIPLVGLDAALAEVPADLLTLCRALDVEHMPTQLSTEVAYAYNWVTGEARELGRNMGHRNYDTLPEPPTDEEIPTTLDVVGSAILIKDGNELHRGYVGDYKTGHTKYPRPGSFAQTLIGALCLRSVLGVDDCTLELIYIDPDDGQHYPVRDTVDAWALEIFAQELRDVMGSLQRLELDYVSGVGLPFREGAHCDYCPAYKHCDAKVQLIRAVPAELVQLGLAAPPVGKKDDAEIVSFAPGVINVSNAAMIYEACERIEAICRRARREVQGLAWGSPVQLSDGRVIERRLHKRRVVDGPKAAAVLEQRYGRDEAMKAVELKVSIDAIRQVVVGNIDPKAKPRQYIERQDGTGVLDQVLDEIDRRGGLATNTSEECKPYQPRKKKLGSGNGG